MLYRLSYFGNVRILAELRVQISFFFDEPHTKFTYR